MQDVALSPFVSALRAQATAALRGWLGLEDGVELSWREVEPQGSVALGLESGGRRLDAVVKAAEPGALWQAGGLQLTVRRPGEGDPQRDPVLRGWLEGFAQRFSGGASPADASLLPALERLRVFSSEGIDDHELRHIASTTEGPSGFLRLGFHCNQRCFICPQGRHWPGAPDDLVLRWLEELAAAGVKQLILSGGEPTTHRLLPEIVRRAARQHGMWVSVQTNAIAFASEALVDRLVEAGLGFAFVSLHSADAAVSDALTRAPGTFERTVRGIHNCLDAGLDVAINCCVEEGTVEGVEAHARFVAEEFARRHPANPVHHVEYSQPGAYYERDLEAASMVSLDRVAPRLAAAARILREADVGVECTGTCGFPLCVLQGSPFLARSERDGRHLAARTFASVCDGCAAKSSCVGVRKEYLALHGEAGLVPFAQRGDHS